MALVVGVTMPNIVDEQVRDRAPFVAPLPQQYIERISNPCEVLTRGRWVVKEVEHDRGIKPQACTIDQVTHDPLGGPQKSGCAAQTCFGPVASAENDRCSGLRV